MNARTKSKLLQAVKGTILGSPLAIAGTAAAAINGPYGLDGNTAFLFHLDETPGATYAGNVQSIPPIYNGAVPWQQTANNVAGSVNTTILGAAGRTGFGSAATFSGNLMLGYDGNNDGTYSPDLILNPTALPNSPDGVSSTLFTDTGGSGAFTLEAMVNFSGALAGGGNREVIAFDANYANGANTGAVAQRGFQFRLNNAGQLEYNSIGDGDGGIVAAVPTTGSNAYAANEWFHVAMTYDGSAGANSVRLYWTKMDDANLQANLIGTGAEGDLGIANNMLTFGNENRNTAGEPLNGLLDEIRVSNVARAANQMMFTGAILNYWNLSTGGDWDAAANWTIGVPNAPAAVAILGGGPNPLAADASITLNGTKTVGALTFDDAAFKFTLASGAAGALALNNGAGIASTMTVLSGSHEIAVPVTIGASGVNVTTATTGTLTVSGNIGGTGALNKAGAGRLVLSGTNNYSGATTVSDGTLAAGGAALSAASNLVINGGVLESAGNFERSAGTAAGQVQLPGGASGFTTNGADIQVAIGTIAAPAAIQWGAATFNPTTLVLNTAAGTHAIDFRNAIDLNGAARTVAVNAQTATLSGVISDSATGGGLTKTGNGTLALPAANTYAGTTAVNGGALCATEGVGLPTASNLSLGGGLLQTPASITRTIGTAAGQIQFTGGNSGFIADGADLSVNLQNGGLPILWGSATFNPASLVLNTATSTNNITVNADIDTGGAARAIQSNGGVNTFAGVISGTGGIDVNPNAAPGVLVVTNGNTYTGNTVLNNSPGVPTRGLAILRAAANNALGTGTVVLGPQGNETQARLELTGGITLPNPIGFNGRNNDSVAIQNVSGDNTLSGLLALNVGGNRYWVQSDAGTLNLSGASPAAAGVAVNVAAGTRILTLRGAGDGVISGAVQNGAGNLSVAKVGTGTWTLSSANNNYTGTTTVSAGTLRLASNLTTSSSATVDGGTLQLAPGLGNNVVLKVPAVTVTGTGKIDLTDNKLIVTTAGQSGTWDGVSAYTAVSGLVDAARGSAGNAQWDGTTGITTTDARAINNGDLLSIGVATVAEARNIDSTATTTFAGQTVLGSDTIAMATWGGDANLDGKINIDDYGQIDSNVSKSGTVFGWNKGDFNYDGKINIDDYGIIDGNIGRQTVTIPTAGGAALDGVAAVPEPASVSLLALGAAALRRRRRRSRA